MEGSHPAMTSCRSKYIQPVFVLTVTGKYFPSFVAFTGFGVEKKLPVNIQLYVVLTSEFSNCFPLALLAATHFEQKPFSPFNVKIRVNHWLVCTDVKNTAASCR